MPASSSPATSSLTRSKATILLVTGLAAACGIYYLHISINTPTLVESEDRSSTGLRRSNAVHRRHRARAVDNDALAQEIETNASNAAQEVGVDATSTLRPLQDNETDYSGTDYDNGSGRGGQHLAQLLFQVSEDDTRRKAYVHRGCVCNSCNELIRGIRYRCSNCIDYDLCEACEAQGHHAKHHIFFKIRVPISSYASRAVQPLAYPGNPESEEAMQTVPREVLARLARETGFERPELDAQWERWTFMATTEWREDPDGLRLAMDRTTFEQCLVPTGFRNYTPPNLIHDRMFAFFDANRDGLISFPEYVHGLAFRRKKAKMRKVFEAYDINDDGYVDRKDFLRLFRCYYTIHKQRQQDMLDGIDEQMMNGSEAIRLVNGRQPLSSIFNGNYPDGRPRAQGLGAGKSQSSDGEVEIVDGEGVVGETSKDHGSRDDLVLDLVTLREAKHTLQPTTEDAFWQGVLRPPRDVDAMQRSVIEGLLQSRQTMITDGHMSLEAANAHPRVLSASEDAVTNDQDHSIPGNEHILPPYVAQVDVDTVSGAFQPHDSISVAQRTEIIATAQKRLDLDTKHCADLVDEKIHERWKRRRFYTDEEEGATAPGDWVEGDDVTAEIGGSSALKQTGSHPLSSRSRSSSKVRFVEDADDYDTRSNPSTSSRSIPERYGGMDIPEAERDAGKEILYMVTQQAFNELLDQLFKEKEDSAMTAMSNNEERTNNRLLFDNQYFKAFAVKVERHMQTLPDVHRKAHRSSTKTEPCEKDWPNRPVLPEIELVDVRQRPLDHLLAVTGYTIEGDSASIEGSPSPGSLVHGGRDSGIILPPYDVAVVDTEAAHETIPTDEATTIQQTTTHRTSSDTLPVESDQAIHPAIPDCAEAHQKGEPLHHRSEPLIQDVYRDPTLPQFRPDTPATAARQERLLSLFRHSVGDSPAVAPSADCEAEKDLDKADEPVTQNAVQERQDLLTPDVLRSQDETVSPVAHPDVISPQFEIWRTEELSRMAKSDLEADAWLLRKLEHADWMALLAFYKADVCEKEAHERGGWGRLNWEEFEAIVKHTKAQIDQGETIVVDGHRVGSLDYLGSWLEFCIP